MTFEIYEDDYAQTACPREDSDGAVELYWDHPNYANQWSGRYCREYPYEEWTSVRPLSEGAVFGAWSGYRIILMKFDLPYEGDKAIPLSELCRLSPEELAMRRNSG